MSGTRIAMPQIGVNEDVATVTEWLVKPGEEVRAGQEIALVETTKASVSLEAHAQGYVYPLVDSGSEVSVRQVVALLLDRPDPEKARRLAAEIEDEGPDDDARLSGRGLEGRRLTRRARALLEEVKVDLSALPTDRIVRESDVLALAPGATGATGSAPTVAAQEPASVPERRVAVYGASFGGAALAEVIVAMTGYEVVAFLDDTPELEGAERFGLAVWPGSSLESLAERGVGAVASHIAIREFRLALRDRARAAGLAMLNAVHPQAHLSPSARLGVGNVIKAGAVVDADVQLGDCCIVDNGAIVPHHNVIGDSVHLAPGVSMGGDCRIGSSTLVGVGASIGARISIGRNVIVATGAVVMSDVPDEVVVEGSPAKIVGSRR